jgi:hypothetical protein
VGVTLYIGGDAGNVRGQPVDLHGNRCFSAARASRGPSDRLDGRKVRGLLDSGAFTDRPAQRLSVEAALARQLLYERKAGARWGFPAWRAHALVSYDVLIDEKWYGTRRVKERWSVAEAAWAVEETIAAARYLASQRDHLAPRRLVLACQGVDAAQYAECAAGVLEVAHPDDWLGLGGFCILGRYPKRWGPTYRETLQRVLPLAVDAGIGHVHIFGVLYLPALGALLFLADQLGLTVSTDSCKPLIAATWADPHKAGMRGATWQENVAWWQRACRELRHSPHYVLGATTGARQLELAL